MQNILIVADSLEIGGIEKSLCSFIHEIDGSNYKIDLQLMKNQGALLKDLPDQVNLLPPLLRGEWKYIFFRCILSLLCRTSRDLQKNAQYVDRYYHLVLPKTKKHYDIAIACHNGKSQSYLVNKVDAGIKIIQNHTDYVDSVELKWVNPIIDKRNFKKVDYVVTVSKSAKKSLLKYFPQFSKKIIVIPNIVNSSRILKLGKMKNPYKNQKMHIATVCRIGREKGIDLAIKTCALCKQAELNIEWYFVGKGDYLENAKLLAIEQGVERECIFVGEKTNPYPYMYYADLYVQPSYTESWGVTIEEAQLLGKAVVTTNLPAFIEQVEDNKNGFVVKPNENEMSEAIQKILRNDTLKKAFEEQSRISNHNNKKWIELYYSLWNKP